MAALCAGINASGDSRAVEFISTRDAATMNARMKVRQFALRPIRVACHLSLVSAECPLQRPAVSYLTRDSAIGNKGRLEKNPTARLSEAR
jgi:hypothetical protein